MNAFGRPFIFLLAAALLSAAVVRAQPDMDYKIVGYYTSWSIYGRAYFVHDIPADKLTHINYAFFNISPGGVCVLGDEWADTQFSYPDDSATDTLRGNFKQLNLLKEKHPHVQTLMAIGGWTWSGRFSDVALTAQSREKFGRSCVEMMVRYGFDGLDIDWEYPGGGGLETNKARPEDTENFTLLLAELRRQLDAQGAQDDRHYLLTIAAPAGTQTKQIQLDQIHQHLDWINVMTYDFYGSWSRQTGFNAPLYAPDADSNPNLNAHAALQVYLAAGIPPAKLLMGTAFYGRGWAKVPETNGGLFQPFDGLPAGTWEAGVYDFKDLAANYLTTYTRYWDDKALVPWLYNADTGVMISYDDAESLGRKAEYIVQNGLGGAMIWELSGDHQAALIATLHDHFNAQP